MTVQAFATDTCAVQGCDRPRHHNGRGQHYAYCGAHRSRLQRHGDLMVDVPLRERGRGCAVDGCARPHKAHGYCVNHYRRWSKTGDPHGSVPRPNAGDEAGYAAVHWRVRRERGNASEHMCSCGSQARQWAYDHNDPEERLSPEGLTFSLKVHHYVPMCVSCHRAFDENYGRSAS